MKRIILGSLFTLLACLLFIAGTIVFTPYPAAYYVRHLFAQTKHPIPDDYDLILQQTETKNNLTYPSTSKKNTYDLVEPKNIEKNQKFPLIIWVHGGAYVGGDKVDVDLYSHYFAANGFVVANMNYNLAPEARYPGPLYQIQELYKYLVQEADNGNYDLSRVYFGGDSAGAQMVAQFVNAQVNPEYAKKANLNAVVPADSIRGAVLYCGPYSLQAISESMATKSKLLAFFMKRIGWAYVGTANWATSEKAQAMAIGNDVTPDFPTAFISDGNIYSFEEQGKELAKQLRAQGVSVTSVFYDKAEHGDLPHEYQFYLTKYPEAQDTLAKSLEFLKETAK